MGKKNDFSKIDNARIILGLGEEAYLKEIKERYRELVLRYHPDRCPEKKKKECQQKFIAVQNAYETLMEYCMGYLFSFKQKEVEKSSPDKQWQEHIERFYSEFFGDTEKNDY